MPDDDHDLARQINALEMQARSLQIGNSILRAERERLERQLADAEARKLKPKINSHALMPFLVGVQLLADGALPMI